jgi:predicted TIM-barrel fold metal-dependent hydrolase
MVSSFANTFRSAPRHALRVLCISLALTLLPAAANDARAGTVPTPVADHHVHLRSPVLSNVLHKMCNSAPRARCPEQLFASMTGETAAQALDRAGVSKAALVSQAYQLGSKAMAEDGDIDSAATAAAVRAENTFVAKETARYPQRFVAFFGVNPLAESALDEIEYWARTGGFIGVKLHLTNAGFSFRTPEHVQKLAAVFDAAEKHHFAILIHMRTRAPDYGTEDVRIFLKDVLPHAPHSVVQIAHAAGWSGIDAPTLAAMDEFVAAFKKTPQLTAHLYFDLSRTEENTQPQAAAQMVRDIRAIGLSHFLMGSDWALATENIGEMNQKVFDALPLDPKEWARIAQTTAPYFKSR